jgi:3-oxoacyl-[acyl-carrier protein] reductase
VVISLKGKTALVCGSTQGIGKAIAIQLAECGANIILLARNEDKLKSVLNELSQNTEQKHSFLIADFSDNTSVVSLASTIAELPIPADRRQEKRLMPRQTNLLKPLWRI